jgi:hypothetical protein
LQVALIPAFGGFVVDGADAVAAERFCWVGAARKVCADLRYGVGSRRAAQTWAGYYHLLAHGEVGL